MAQKLNSVRSVAVFLKICAIAVLASGCVGTVNGEPPEAHIVVGLRVYPEHRTSGFTALAKNLEARVQVMRAKDTGPKRFRKQLWVESEDGWTYHVVPVQAGHYFLENVLVRGGGAQGTETTRLAKYIKRDGGGYDLRAPYLFEVKSGTVSYIGSFDIDAWNIPVEIDVKQDLDAARAAALAENLDASGLVSVKSVWVSANN
ncbi:hypothetical protein [Nisaea sediminum]|uniref:hypothetical protein n=1 Tax=Nisaea sediminum TaxID=2775867 RepID=UPI0018670971|nr:hypothetical protein [Nisaea sediminum]